MYGVVDYSALPPEAAGADHSEDLGVARAFILSVGVADGELYQYMDFGAVNPVLPAMYIPMRDGKPVPGQHPIVDALPGNEGYGPYWQVIEVEVDSDYEANDLKSLGGIHKADLKLTPRGEAVHCPVVNPDALWLTADLAPLTIFWGTGEALPNPAYDPTAPTGADNQPLLLEPRANNVEEGVLLLQPVWQKRLLGFCWSESLDRRYPTEQLPEGAGLTLASNAISTRFEQIQADAEGGPLIDENTGGPIPWPTLPLFGAAPGDAGDFPARRLLWIPTATEEQLTNARELDEAAAIEVGLVDNVLFYPYTPPEPEPEPEQ